MAAGARGGGLFGKKGKKKKEKEPLELGVPPTPVITGAPASSVVTFRLDPGQQIMGGGGRMVFKRGNVSFKARADGARSAFGRWFANEGMFRNAFTGGSPSDEGGPGDDLSGGTVSFSGTLPGDVVEVVVEPWEELVTTRASYICSDMQVGLSGKWNKRGLLGIGQEEGAVVPRVFIQEGCPAGRVWLSSFGSIDRHELSPGESIWVDNGCFMASTIRYKVDRTTKGLGSAFLGGEGYAMRFEGPGVVYTQSRNFNDFVSRVDDLLPKRSRAGGGGGGVVAFESPVLGGGGGASKKAAAAAAAPPKKAAAAGKKTGKAASGVK